MKFLSIYRKQSFMHFHNFLKEIQLHSNESICSVLSSIRDPLKKNKRGRQAKDSYNGPKNRYSKDLNNCDQWNETFRNWGKRQNFPWPNVTLITSRSETAVLLLWMQMKISFIYSYVFTNFRESWNSFVLITMALIGYVISSVNASSESNARVVYCSFSSNIWLFFKEIFWISSRQKN
jgi:hypothetical protein